jgi:hypothetical protein
MGDSKQNYRQINNKPNIQQMSECMAQKQMDNILEET